MMGEGRGRGRRGEAIDAWEQVVCRGEPEDAWGERGQEAESAWVPCAAGVEAACPRWDSS